MEFPAIATPSDGAEDLTCAEVVEVVTDYLEESLESDELARIRKHLLGCIGCDNYLGEVRVTLRVLSNRPAEPLPEDLAQRLVVLYREWSKRGHT